MTTKTTRTESAARAVALPAGAGLIISACGDDDSGGAAPQVNGTPDSEAAQLAPTVDHPYVAFALVDRAVYEGEETDPESGETVELRVESVVWGAPVMVAGTEVTVVDVADYEDGEIVGHAGQWLAGEDDNRAGLFMPATPAVGTVFEQERAPGVAEDYSTVIEAGLTITVPAGTFNDCIKTEDVDPIDDVTEHKYYCSGVGLVKEEYDTGSLVLVEFSSGSGST